MKFGAVILAGGESRRMGTDKAQLKLDGKTFLARIAGELSDFDELYVSVGENRSYPIEIPRVTDVFSRCGPMCGIHAALSACQSDALLVVSCDLPLYRRDLGEKLVEAMTPDYDVVIPKTPDGRQHPLCAVYSKSCLPVFESDLKVGGFKLMRALEHLSVKYVEVDDLEGCLTNINTCDDYKKLVNPAKRQTILAIAGVKNSGKTTLLERLIPVLNARDVLTAVIKHDAHSFTPDTPGKDTFRFFQAGALGTAIFDGEKFNLSRRVTVSERELIPMFPEADLIILEGFIKSQYPKIELVRQGNSEKPISDPNTCLAYVSALDLETEKPILHPDDIESIADFICGFMRFSTLGVEE